MEIPQMSKSTGKMKVKTHKHQKVRDIHIEIQRMSKSAGNQIEIPQM